MEEVVGYSNDQIESEGGCVVLVFIMGWGRPSGWEYETRSSQPTQDGLLTSYAGCLLEVRSQFLQWAYIH